MSKDSPQALKNFQEKCSFPYLMVGDPSTEIIQAYGAWGQKKLYGREYMGTSRISYLIDDQGKIERVFEKVNVKTHACDVLEALKQD